MNVYFKNTSLKRFFKNIYVEQQHIKDNDAKKIMSIKRNIKFISLLSNLRHLCAMLFCALQGSQETINELFEIVKYRMNPISTNLVYNYHKPSSPGRHAIATNAVQCKLNATITFFLQIDI